MHNHSDGEGGHRGMMWMMLICCLFPIVVLFGGTTFFKSIDYGWVGIVLVGGFILFHCRHMFGLRSTRKQGEELTDNNVKKDDDSKNHKNCCH